MSLIVVHNFIEIASSPNLRGEVLGVEKIRHRNDFTHQLLWGAVHAWINNVR